MIVTTEKDKLPQKVDVIHIDKYDEERVIKTEDKKKSTKEETKEKNPR